tara:strand:- start:6932 stop:7873 length:942 start_codon:yes stop_codon:yes gene_type:complete
MTRVLFIDLLEPKDFLSEFKKYRQGMFESHAIYILQKFLNPWAERNIFNSLGKKLDFINDRSAIILDNRANEILRFSVLNTLIMTDLKLPIKIYTTKKAFSDIKKLFLDILDFTNLVEINLLEIDEINIVSYNNLLKSSNFWAKIQDKKVLIFQTDALLIEPLEFSMFKYDYIGALFSKGKSRSIRIPHFNKESREEVGCTWITQKYNENLGPSIIMGNGGLSIRNCEIMEKICSNETSNQNENEDIFFGKYLKKYTSQLPTNTKIINRFSIEADFHNSIAFHGSHFYLDHSELSSIYDRHLRTLIGLLSYYD